MQPISFTPIYLTRVWGGRHLDSVYKRQLPDEQPYGESWEISDRADHQSVVSSSKFKNLTLNALWTEHRDEIFGANLPDSERFPILVKILDAQSDLSIQVHPPESIANCLGGEPKTEMWYIANSKEGSKLYVGLKGGVSKQSFETAIHQGTVDHQVHAIEAKPKESIFIPSGRLHAIGGGFVIYEIQQNSDTTYRVFDWNRLGLDGKPRDLHVAESLQCIDFNDYEPEMNPPQAAVIANCQHFHVEERNIAKGESFCQLSRSHFAIITVVEGSLTSTDGTTFNAGDFFILPVHAAKLKVSQNAKILETTIPIS